MTRKHVAYRKSSKYCSQLRQTLLRDVSMACTLWDNNTLKTYSSSVMTTDDVPSSHLSPARPGGQEQKYSLSGIATHVPPASHGFSRQESGEEFLISHWLPAISHFTTFNMLSGSLDVSLYKETSEFTYISHNVLHWFETCPLSYSI